MSNLNPTAFETAVKKSIYGVVANLDVFFLGYRYDQALSDTRGHVTPRPPGFYFLGSEHQPIEVFQKLSDRESYLNGWSLGVQVKPDVIKVVESCCCEGKIGAFRIIPWKDTGHALVVATDTVHIANPYLGFVPIDTLPVINKVTHPLVKYEG